VVGPSGSGKTTTLRLIAGLEQATSGTVWIGGREATKFPPRARNVAMVFQGLGLYEHLNVAENLAFGLKVRGEREARSQVEEVAKLLGIETLLARKPGELSGGEQQRVALGRAVVRSPAALLLDEPLSSLDPPLRSELRQLLRELQQRLKVTTVYVTHDQAEAMSLTQRIAVMRAGRIEQVGTPEEIYNRPANRFVAGFFGDGMNWDERGESRAEKAKQFEGIFGVRPEDVVLVRGDDGSMTGTVSGVQWLGPHTMVEVRVLGMGGGDWKVRVGGKVEFQVGEKVAVKVAEERKRWFDGMTGRRRDDD
jgi:ABC-type sugar transport system ATPase subunit